jgi:hypothetical protein
VNIIEGVKLFKVPGTYVWVTTTKSLVLLMYASKNHSINKNIKFQK